jgi:hypothetical protein
MNKKINLFVILLVGSISFLSAMDQIFFELNGGVWFYPGVGGKVGWIHHWDNDKIGFICDISYYNNGFVDKHEGNWREEIKIAHNLGLAVGIVFNNMGFNGLFRTSQYIKIKGLLSFWDNPSFAPGLDIGLKLNIFFIEKIALSAGIGFEIPILYPYFSLGMTFTL